MEAVTQGSGLILDRTITIEDAQSGYTYFRDGDVVVAKITPCFENGKLALAAGLKNGVALGTTELHVVRGNAVLAPEFLFYLVASDYFRKLGECEMYGAGGQKRVPAEFVLNFGFALPPLDEQRAIAAFLDRETAQIDALIAKLEQLIALLQEKRQALTSHAVTKGLDPAAPMKDSGVEWLGEVPAHWEVTRLKFVASIQTGVAKGRDMVGRKTVEVHYLRVANVQDGYLNLGDVATIEVGIDELDRYLLHNGDVLMNEGGDYDKLGRGAVWRAEIDPCIHQNHVFALRPVGISSEWLSTATGSYYAKIFFERSAKQTTNLASISSTNLSLLPMLKPPVHEIEEILRYAELGVLGIIGAIQDAERMSNLLAERRAALITAAVTGSIDVRGLSELDV